MSDTWIRTLKLLAVLVMWGTMLYIVVHEYLEEDTQCEQSLAEKTRQLQLKISEYNLCEEMWTECYNSLSIVCGPRPITKSGFVLSRWNQYCAEFEDYYEE